MQYLQILIESLNNYLMKNTFLFQFSFNLKCCIIVFVHVLLNLIIFCSHLTFENQYSQVNIQETNERENLTKILRTSRGDIKHENQELPGCCHIFLNSPNSMDSNLTSVILKFKTGETRLTIKLHPPYTSKCVQVPDWNANTCTSTNEDRYMYR